MPDHSSTRVGASSTKKELNFFVDDVDQNDGSIIVGVSRLPELCESIDEEQE